MTGKDCSLTSGIRQKLVVSLKGGAMKLSGITGHLFRQKKSPFWWICIIYKGKRYRFSTKTESREKAEAILAETMLKLYKGRATEQIQTKKENPQKKDITLREFFFEHYYRYCEGINQYPRGKKYIFDMIPEWFKDLKVKNISLRDAELLQGELVKRGYKAQTVNRIMNLVKHCFTKLVDWEMVEESKLKMIRKVKNLKTTSRLRYLTEEEIERFLQACDKKIYPIVLTALHTGMRRGEIFNLKWDNVDLKNGLILLERTKNGERREIPMSETLKTLFRKLFTERRLDTDYVFANQKTGKRYVDIKRSFTSACKKAGIRDFHFHDLRHTFASQLVMRGVDIKTVQELLGHKTITMTLRYAHLSASHMKEAVKALDGITSVEGKKVQSNG